MSDEEIPAVNETSRRLAESLSHIKGIPPGMIKQARAGYYHDYVSPLAFPDVVLIETLQGIASQPTTGDNSRLQIMDLMAKIVNGEFDGTKEEAEAWMASEPDAKAAFEEFRRNVRRKLNLRLRYLRCSSPQGRQSVLSPGRPSWDHRPRGQEAGRSNACPGRFRT